MFLPPKAEKRPGVIFQHMEKPRIILQHRALQTYFWWQEGPPFVKGQGLEMHAQSRKVCQHLFFRHTALASLGFGWAGFRCRLNSIERPWRRSLAGSSMAMDEAMFLTESTCQNSKRHSCVSKVMSLTKVVMIDLSESQPSMLWTIGFVMFSSDSLETSYLHVRSKPKAFCLCPSGFPTSVGSTR